MELEVPAAVLGGDIPDREQDLVRRARTDPGAFAELDRTHYRAIAGYIHRRTGDVHLTEDLASDVFMIALRTLPRFRHRGVPIRSWLYRIAANRVNRWARRERRKAAERLTGEMADPRSMQSGAELTGEVARAALLSIAPRYQSVLTLYYLEGLSVEQVARTLGCRIGTVKSRLSRGRDAMRRRLEQRRTQS